MGSLFWAKAYLFEWTEATDVGTDTPYEATRSALVIAKDIKEAVECWEQGHMASLKHTTSIKSLEVDRVVLSESLEPQRTWTEETA